MLEDSQPLPLPRAADHPENLGRFFSGFLFFFGLTLWVARICPGIRLCHQNKDRRGNEEMRSVPGFPKGFIKLFLTLSIFTENNNTPALLATQNITNFVQFMARTEILINLCNSFICWTKQ